jgi:hypothetical protein
MALPWLQIVQLVPSILDVSKELLRRSKTPPPGFNESPQTDAELAARILALEENERRQAELVSQMAEQMATVARALSSLHRQVMWLTIAVGVAIVLALVAIGIAAR